MFYWFIRKVFGPLLRLIYRPWVRGMENVPDEGPAILASNHLAVIDSFFLPMVMSRSIVFVGKSDYFTGTGLKGRLVAFFMRGIGTIPIDRSSGKAAQGALDAGRLRLESGQLFGIYPEGTRSPDGRLYRGKTGVARLALETGVPVIPVAMIGTDLAQPIGKRIPRLRRTGIVFGEPLDFSRYAGMENDRFVLRSITDEIMYQLMTLSGQEYVDTYAATMKARIAAGGLTPEAEQRPHAPGGRPVPELEVPGPPPEETKTSGGDVDVDSAQGSAVSPDDGPRGSAQGDTTPEQERDRK